MDLAAADAGTGRAGASGSGPRTVRWLLLTAALPALHLLMFGYDLQHPDRFLNADRAGARVEVLEGFRQAWLSGGDLVAFFARHGIVGDWLPQALLYLWGGQSAVIAVQVLLALASVVWVRDIGRSVGLAPEKARGAALLYGFLPHTLVLSHQLASEAIFVPLVIGGFALFARASTARPHGRGPGAAGAMFGAATLVRPITLLWPLLCLPFIRPAGASWRARGMFLAAALGPLLLWMLFILSATGEFSMGRSDHDLGHNLHDRAGRIAAAAGVPAPAGARGDHTLTLSEYGAFALRHPGPTLAHSARDMAVLGVKSGLERVVLDYLNLAPGERAELQSTDGWRAQLETQGAWKTFTGILKRDPSLMLTGAIGAVLFVCLMLLAVAGAIAWLRDGVLDARTQRLRILLILFPLYILATAQVVDAAQSRHRAPAEFALCLLAAAGLPMLRRLSIGGRRAG